MYISTITSARAGVLHSPNLLSHKEKKFHFPTLNGLRTVSTSSFTQKVSPKKNLGSLVLCKAPEATDTVQAVTEDNWQELVLGSKTLVLVDFWAPWCGPCRMIAPVVDELAKEYAGKIQCYKLNTDDCPNLPTQLGIRSIPTVLFFKNGERKESIIGAVPKSTLAASIDKYLDA